MDIRMLRQFTVLAEALHFGRASETSSVSPSALSRSMQQLEHQLGVRLLERDNRTVALTPAGELFLNYARDALAQWELIRHDLLEQAGELRGEVSIYCSVTASYSFLYDLLSRFRRDHPRIEIKLHTGDPDHAVHRVLAGDEDMAIGARPDRMPAELVFQPIAATPLVFIAAKGESGYARLVRRQRDRAAWQATPMILAETGLARQRVDSWFRSFGVKPTIYAQVAGNEAIVSMVSLGFGVGVVPKIALDNSPLASAISVLDVRPRLEAYEVGLFARKKRLRSPLIAAFWGQLK
jgi:LysR family positive regulator for ilvC